ncbi:hypothetical protein E4U21_001265 [Claviceps maximensis]|nr:hypothetical protein E4U21_001265 [Claviceps maximensis]
MTVNCRNNFGPHPPLQTIFVRRVANNAVEPDNDHELRCQIEFGLQNQNQLLGIEDGQTSNSSWASSKQQPYYSNKGMHNGEQDRFERSPHPKPLPAAVLFNAYDDVLPTFGIDPDSEHHLSALIFRIGGESGNGSLLEKFHALLKRMDIVLEFDDDATVSELPSSVHSLSCHEAAGTSAPQTPGSLAADEVKDDTRPRVNSSTIHDHGVNRAQNSHVETTSGAQNLHGLQRIQPGYHLAQESRQQRKNVLLDAASTRSDRELRQTFDPMENSAVKSNDGNLAFRRAAMISAIDRWRQVTFGETITRIRDYISMVTDDGRGRRNSMNNYTDEDRFKVDSKHVQIETSLKAVTYDLSTAENNALLLRAARARQIFLASRILSRWADETATRLDREAIARRHIVRFRCFNSWIQAPNPTQPSIRRLKALSAIQKLQRAVCRNAEQLKFMASSTATSRISKTTFRILNFWFNSVLSEFLANRTMRLARTATTDRWLKQTWNRNELRSNIAWWNRHSRFRRSLNTWANHETEHRFQIGSVQQLTRRSTELRWLHTWSNFTEIVFRAASCRQVLAMEMSIRELEIWRLGARTEAFLGRRQCALATKYVHAWIAGVSHQSRLRVSSEVFCRFKSAIKLASHLTGFTQIQQQSDVLGYRALWYIRATFLLDRVGAGVRHKKQQIKVVVRRYLMKKYTQVSSQRRRRSFFTALTRWQSYAKTLKATLSECRILHNTIRKGTTCVSWRNQAVEGVAFHDLAISHREQHFLHEWRKRTVANYQQQLDAAELWASEQQRQSLKAWARSTLQKGGQAHSATMVRCRHERDHRNKSFQRWRHLASRLKDVEAFSDLQSPARSVQIHDSHKTTLKRLRWPPLARRPDYKQEALTPFHTPSRSTGLLFPSSHLPDLRFTDPVADRGKRLEHSGAGKSELLRQGLAGLELRPGQGVMPITTPKTPVPAHVQNRSRYIPALTGYQERGLLRLPPSRGHPIQVSGSNAAASQSQNDKDEADMPSLALNRSTALHEFSLPGPHSRHSYAKTGAVRMRRWQSGLRTEILTPLRTTENMPQD